jgi:hypothetical protein
MSEIIKITELLKNGLIIPVVGAGVSFATAGLPGWKGLIEDGLKFAEDRNADSSIIQEGRDLLEANKLTKAASVVKKLLNAPGHPFANWINDALGRPEIKSTSWSCYLYEDKKLSETFIT